jgi:microcystin-dependent protein
MSNPFVGEIRLFGGNFAPAGWAFCNGQLLSIAENETLFNLIGTTYGGDGQSTFALPDLRGRVPVHAGQGPGLSNYILGQSGGAEDVTLTADQIPAHSHVPQASAGAGGQASPAGNVWANSTNLPYSPNAPTAAMAAAAVGPAGGNQPHDNMVPFVAVSFIISLFGVFPTQN